MNTTLHHVSFPGESPEYRNKRNALLENEISLRRQVEAVAAQRRALPPGGAPPEDYRFIGKAGPVAMSAMFTQGRDTLAVYSFMFGRAREPCPGCTHFLDGLDGLVEHISQRLTFAGVAKSPLEAQESRAYEDGSVFRSTQAGNNFDRDYCGDFSALSPAVRTQQEFKDGEEWDMPMLNVFRQAGGKVRHFWGSKYCTCRRSRAKSIAIRIS